MFTGELAESRQTEITIRDIDELAMELLIDFCYTSHIIVEESNVQTLLPAGMFLFFRNRKIKLYLFLNEFNLVCMLFKHVFFS